MLPANLNDVTKEAIALAVPRGWMLDRGDGGAVAVAEDGAQGDTRDRPLIGCDLGLVAVAVGNKEANAGIAISRIKCDADWRSAVDPRAGKRNLTGKRGLASPDESPHAPVGPQAVF